MRQTRPSNLLYSAGNRGIYSIDITNGDVNILSEFSVGKGPVLSSAQRLVINENNKRALIIDREIRALFSVNLKNGKRKIISNDERGNGDIFIFPSDVQWDTAGRHAFVKDITLVPNEANEFDGPTVIRKVSLRNGDRSILLDSDSQCGQPLAQTWDAQNSGLLW